MQRVFDRPYREHIQGRRNSFDTLSIDSVTADGNIVFSLFWYRIFSIDDFAAKAYGDYVPFHYNYTQDSEAWGVIKFNTDKTAKVTFIESSLPYLEQGTFDYEYYTPEEIIEDKEETAKSFLTQQDASRGWTNDDNDIYLSFNANGTMKCYFSDPPYGDMPFDGYTWNYEIHGETITINGNDYKYSGGAGLGAAIQYTFEAVGDDPFGIAGWYHYEKDGVYPVIKQSMD